jgi:hypothetical protein
MIPYHLSNSDGRPYLRHRSPSGAVPNKIPFAGPEHRSGEWHFHPKTRHPQAVTPGGTGAILRPGVCLGGARIRVPSVGKPGHTPGNVKLLLPPRQSRGNSQCIKGHRTAATQAFYLCSRGDHAPAGCGRPARTGRLALGVDLRDIVRLACRSGHASSGGARPADGRRHGRWVADQCNDVPKESVAAPA